MDILRVHGGKPKYHHSFIGGNFRLDELQAAVLNIKLKHLDAWTAGRQHKCSRLRFGFRATEIGRHHKAARGSTRCTAHL